jgi:hypothetical protein
MAPRLDQIDFDLNKFRGAEALGVSKNEPMLKTLPACVLLSLAFVAGIFILPQSTHAQEGAVAKRLRLLNESKVSFTKVSENILTVPFKGKELGNFEVFVSGDKDILVMFVTVATQQQYKPSVEMFGKLLSENQELDRVKIGIGKEGDVAVRIDLTMRTLDKRELTENLDQLAAASDQVFGGIKPFLIKTN